MKYLVITLIAFLLISCQYKSNEIVHKENLKIESLKHLEDLEIAYFASGCFWCVEAIFESVKGVEEVISGYGGGVIKDPGYKLICTGTTKHAEAVKVYYDADVVSYQDLLVVFFGSHDPTTLNRQGNDSGPQYRSMIFYQNEKEKNQANDYVKSLESVKTFDEEIVTEIVPLTTFYDAEDYHQNYERLHPNDSYVKSVSIPRLRKFQKKYPQLLKKSK